MTEQTTRLVLPSHIEAVGETAAAVTDFVKSCGFDEQTAFGVDMALREAVTNAVVHGNQEDETKSVEVIFSCLGNALEIEIRDQGEGFDPVDVPDPVAGDNLLRQSGRGVFLMKTFMDEFAVRRLESGTEVTLVKNLVPNEIPNSSV